MAVEQHAATHHLILHRRSLAGSSVCSVWPDPWRMALIALCALILCSCRSPGGRNSMRRRTGWQPVPRAGWRPVPRAGGETLPRRGLHGGGRRRRWRRRRWSAGHGTAGVPLPYAAAAPWSPPGIRQPWPEDEYLCDGGDERQAGGSQRQEGDSGPENGRHRGPLRHARRPARVVEPSNEVCLYSPRFGAVRQVVGLMADEERQQTRRRPQSAKARRPDHPPDSGGSAKQNIQAGDQIAARPPVAMRSKQGDGVMSSDVGPRGFQNAFKPYENLAIIRLGMFEESEMPLLARGSTAAIAWSHTQAVQVILDHQGAMAEVKYDNAASVYTVATPPGNPRLRLVKLASTAFAKPGEEVDFTIRFDNVGDQPIGNVTILDSLSTRLEYVPDSAQCSVEAKFSTQPNEGDSVVVRCEVAKPLDPGQGGILRFRCRVR